MTNEYFWEVFQRHYLNILLPYITPGIAALEK